MLKKVWEWIKEHPLITAGIFVGLLIIYYFMSSSSSASSATGTASGPTAADLQLAQLQASQNVAQLQAQAGLQSAQIQAGVAGQQISAQQESTDAQTAAQLAAIQAQTGAQVSINAAQIQGQTQQTQAMANVIMDQYDQQTAQQANVVSYLNNLTNAQAGVALSQIDATKSLVTQQQQNQYNLNQASLGYIDHINGSQNRLALLLSTQGNQAGSIAAAQGQTLSSISGDSLLSNIGRASAGALATILG